jgi:hypothetical protein
MAKTAGRFGYEIRAPKKHRGVPFMPFKAIIHIVPTHYSKDKDGWPRLSPELMSEQEIDWYVQACKEDLDRVGRLAKRTLQRANQRTHELTKAQTVARKDESK